MNDRGIVVVLTLYINCDRVLFEKDSDLCQLNPVRMDQTQETRRVMKKHSRDQNSMRMAAVITVICILLFGGLLYLMSEMPPKKTSTKQTDARLSPAPSARSTTTVYSVVMSTDGFIVSDKATAKLRAAGYDTNFVPVKVIGDENNK